MSETVGLRSLIEKKENNIQRMADDTAELRRRLEDAAEDPTMFWYEEKAYMQQQIADLERKLDMEKKVCVCVCVCISMCISMCVHVCVCVCGC